MSERFEELLESAEDAIEELDEMDLEIEADDPDGLLEELTYDQIESLIGNLEALSELVEEAIDLLEAIEFSELPDAIDRETAFEAIQTGEIPKAITEGESEDVIRIGRLARAINLTELWDAIDVYDFLESVRQIDDDLEELEEESEEGSLLDETAEAMMEDDEEGWTDDFSEVGEEFGDELAEEVGSMDLSEGMSAEESRAYQSMIQQAAMAGIDEFREALIATHGEFQKLYEFNREKMRRTDRGSSSRNPTAVSSMPIERGDLPSVARTTTVPQKVRHSSGPTRKRIYGRRFEAELERQRADRGESDGR